jgi:hypothetical protein
MKKTLLLFACSGTLLATAQNAVNVTPQQYDQLKKNNQLDLTKKYQFIGNSLNQLPVRPSDEVLAAHGTRAVCSCLIPLDSTFSVVPFNSVDSSSNPADHRNDDGYTDIIVLPFTFNFFGTAYDSLYINNNGNISFVAPYYNYTADSFPSSNFNMIAPFWSDVDTRDSTSGLVYYKITSTAMIVKWENVGYYQKHMDKSNTFQLIITDGTDPLLPAGTNVAFCYGDMSWTTGDASNGMNGYGGTPATVGVNQGNGIDYFQVGRFDHAGNTFDGPYNAIDSVDFLDNQEMYFNVALSGNLPPVVINANICDTIDVYTGDTLRSPNTDSVMFAIAVSTPEINQTVNATITSTASAGHFSYVPVMTTPTYKSFECKFLTANLSGGLYNVNITATDNGTPTGQTNRSVVIRVIDGTAGIKENKLSSLAVYPNPTDGYIYVKHNFSAASNPMLSIVNIIGETVSTVQLNNQHQGVDISALPKGVYFATVSSKEGKSKSFKIVHK